MGPRYAKQSRQLADGRRIRVVHSSPERAEPPEPTRCPRDPVLIEAERRLLAWAKWAKDNRESIGYSTVSTLYRAMMTTKVGIIRGGAIADARVVDPTAKTVEVRYPQGADGVETRSFRPPEVLDAPPQIMQTDRAVARIPAKPRKVLIVDYFARGSIEERCRETPYKRARYLQLLETAKYAVYMALLIEQAITPTLV